MGSTCRHLVNRLRDAVRSTVGPLRRNPTVPRPQVLPFPNPAPDSMRLRLLMLLSRVISVLWGIIVLLYGLSLGSGFPTVPPAGTPATATEQPARPYTPMPEQSIAEIAAALDREAAFVTRGAFVLGTQPRMIREDMVLAAEAYVPVGTVVFTDACTNPIRERVGDLGERVDAHYCRITTSSGLDGYVRADRIERLQGRTVAIATREDEIEVVVSQGNAQTFSRTSGVFVEITDSFDQHYVVRMPWSGQVGRLNRDPRRRFVVVSPESPHARPVTFSAMQTGAAENWFGIPMARISEEIGEAVGGSVSWAEVSNHLCGVGIQFRMSAGASILDTGVVMEWTNALADQATSQDYRLHAVLGGSETLRRLLSRRTFSCVGTIVDRMHGFEVVVDAFPSEHNSFSFRRTAGPENSILVATNIRGMFEIWWAGRSL